MGNRILALAAAAAMLLAGIAAPAESEVIERGAYIQWDGNGETAVYAPDGALLYPAGQYEARRSGDGLIHIQGDRGAGVLDAAGNILVKPEWGWTDDYSDGRVCVFWGGKVGALDEQGVEVVGLDWDRIYGFHNGFAHVRLDGKSGVIDRSGRVVVAPVWDRIDNDTEDNAFCEGVAFAGKDGAEFLVSLETGEAIVCLDDRAGLNTSGFHDGLALVRTDGSADGYTGFIDRTGRVVMQYDAAQDFCNGYALVSLDGETFAIDRAGNRFEKQVYWAAVEDEAWSDCFPHFKSESGKYGFVDRSGAYVIPPEFDFCLDWSNGHVVLFKGDPDGDAREGTIYLADAQGHIEPVSGFTPSDDILTAIHNAAEYCGCAKLDLYDY